MQFDFNLFIIRLLNHISFIFDDISFNFHWTYGQYIFLLTQANLEVFIVLVDGKFYFFFVLNFWDFFVHCWFIYFSILKLVFSIIKLLVLLISFGFIFSRGLNALDIDRLLSSIFIVFHDIIVNCRIWSFLSFFALGLWPNLLLDCLINQFDILDLCNLFSSSVGLLIVFWRIDSLSNRLLASLNPWW